MSDMKCPFCQQELVRHWGMEEPALYCCDNPKCSRGGVATESAWQELIRTKKQLELATKCINWTIDTFQKGLEHEADVAGCCELTLWNIQELEPKD